jgi:hypothetical protein
MNSVLYIYVQAGRIGLTGQVLMQFIAPPPFSPPTPSKFVKKKLSGQNAFADCADLENVHKQLIGGHVSAIFLLASFVVTIERFSGTYIFYGCNVTFRYVLVSKSSMY